MKIINVKNGSPEWHDWRKTGIGGSDIAAIMGVCPFRTRDDVLKDKLGINVNKPNEAMQRGIKYEPEARATFEAKQGRKYPPIMMQDDECEYFIASLDGWDDHNDVSVEIKVPGQRTIDLAACGVIPKNYEYQVQWQLGITGAYYHYYVVYDYITKEMHVIEVNVNRKLQSEMREAAHKFWAEVLVARDGPPHVNERFISNNDALQKAWAIKEDIKKLEREYDFIMDELFVEHGKDKTMKGDNYVLQRTERESFDYRQAAIDAFLPLDKYIKPKTVSWTLRKRKSDDANLNRSS
jgi:putative phage-type endonuclease